ncbi:DUF3618 domain-containing protein [Actinoplanes sp. HUAS TT8]|uniref:DUF3618 domain-containing protein n=1 Tax=Actinoplanes sp. HUAS TT8 TaxID=3447453 RepID=UPI003F524E9F
MAVPSKPEISESGKSAESGQGTGALRAEIEETRAEMGATVEALVAKADVPARVADKVDQVKAAGEKAKAAVGVHATGHIAEATAQTGTRMACQAADAAERATAAIGSARRRVAANPKQFALIGAALATAAAGVALIRRSR